MYFDLELFRRGLSRYLQLASTYPLRASRVLCLTGSAESVDAQAVSFAKERTQNRYREYTRPCRTYRTALTLGSGLALNAGTAGTFGATAVCDAVLYINL